MQADTAPRTDLELIRLVKDYGASLAVAGIDLIGYVPEEFVGHVLSSVPWRAILFSCTSRTSEV